MAYKYKEMLSDMRHDLAKYIELYPSHSNKTPSTIKVLLHSPAFFVIAGYRVLFWLKNCQETSGSLFIKVLIIALHLFTNIYSRIVVKIQISHWPEIGPGLYLSNKGGIIMGPQKIGANCVIHHNVTIGVNQERDHPNIGSNVWIGPNSLVCGKIIQDNVIIKAGTIIGKNIPANTVITGNPGKIISRNLDDKSLFSNYACDSQKK
jgi:serine O-acetyltransferase